MWTAFRQIDQNQYQPDRFIPNRKSFNNSQILSKSFINEQQDHFLDQIIQDQKRLLNFNKNSQNQNSPFNPIQNSTNLTKPKNSIQHTPIKVLEAPGLRDDFYLNLVAWGNNNQIAVALHNTLYQFNTNSNRIIKGLSLSDNIMNDSTNMNEEQQEQENYICSLAYNDLGSQLAVTDASGKLFITDSITNRVILDQQINFQRTGSLGWQNNLLAAGSKDKIIRLFDVWQNEFEPVFSFVGHQQEICGLKFSFDGNYIASGGNDNQLMIWDLRKMSLLNRLGEHNAAVKALAWNPTQRNILASGSGTSDRNIWIFDINNPQELIKMDTGSQVCNLTFDLTGKQLLSTHGYSLNQLITWGYNKKQNWLEKKDLFIAHKHRVLYLAASPCGQQVVTGAGAGDETLRIWKVFQEENNKRKTSMLNSAFLGMR